MKRCKEKILLESRLKSDFPQNFFTEVTAALYPLCFDPEREAVKDLLIDIIHKKKVKKTLFKAIFLCPYWKLQELFTTQIKFVPSPVEQTSLHVII